MNNRDPKSTVIGVGLRDGTTRWETSMALIRVALSKIADYRFELVPGGGCDIAHARNSMLHYARTRTDAARILYIDADENFGCDHVERLVRWMVEDPSIRYLAGLYPLKGMELRWSYGGWSKESPAKPGLWEVFEVATGFTGIDLGLVDEMIAKHPEWAYEYEDFEYKGEIGHEIFAMGPVEGNWVPGRTYRRRMPEDFMFSLRAREHGETIYVDPKIQLGHMGMIDMLKLHKPGEKEITQGHA